MLIVINKNVRSQLNRLVLILFVTSCAVAQDSGWFARAERARAAQPHWLTPLATTTPRLEQEFRYDIVWQELGGGRNVTNFGNSKGLELIPTERTEIILGVPPYFARNFAGTPDGFGDFAWLFKYRVASAPEKHGNYIISAFLGGTLPTGSHENGAEHATLTPTLGYGKGYGSFDVQGTFGVTIPVTDASALGTPVSWNNAFQYHIAKKLWPEIEINTTFFPNGPHEGMKQVFFTPGLVVGRFSLTRHLGLTFGAGIQIAATRFHTSNHNAIISVRLPF